MRLTLVQLSRRKFRDEFSELKKSTLETTTVSEYLMWLFKDRDFTLKGMRKKLEEKKLKDIRLINSYFDQEIAKLGPDLHSATYTVKLGGRFRLQGSSRWIGLDPIDKNVKLSDILPQEKTSKFKVEGIDLSKTVIQAGGLTNFESCNNLKTLYLRDCYFVDDWCLSEISHTFANRLENLDLSGCQSVSDSGLWTLGYLKKLKKLNMERMEGAENKEYLAVLLEEHIQGLEISGVDHLSEETLKNYEKRVLKKE